MGIISDNTDLRILVLKIKNIAIGNETIFINILNGAGIK